MKRKVYNELESTEVNGRPCKVVRITNKVILLFEGAEGDPPTNFTVVGHLLAELGNTHKSHPRTISVDAMVVGWVTGEVSDYLGCVKASRVHDIVVYEDRGTNLNYLLPPPDRAGASSGPTDCWGHPVPAESSGSERLQEKIETEGKKKNTTTNKKKQSGRLRQALQAVGSAAASLSVTAAKKLKRTKTSLRKEEAVRDWLKPALHTLTIPPPTPTRAQMGLVQEPVLYDADNPLQHLVNAFREFIAITVATKKTNEDTLRSILTTFERQNEGLLAVKLKEAEAAIYNNTTAEILRGSMSGDYMAAYSSQGYVKLDEGATESTGRKTFATTEDIVVVSKSTRIMLEDKVLQMAEIISGPGLDGSFLDDWTLPKIDWVNGVPGCGKSTWIVSHFDTVKDLIVTTTTEAANDLRAKLEPKIGDDAKRRVRTMASVLANGVKKEKYGRVMIDEALMNHFGSVVMAVKVTRADEAIIVGDVNQLPHIDRLNLFEQKYNKPTAVVNITRELLCTYRNPMDVAYALSEIYGGIYSAKQQVHSLKIERYTGAVITKNAPKTLFLTHTQAEKASLITQGYGAGEESRVLTIHEAQGLTFGPVIIIRTAAKATKLHNSVPHAVVAVSRHTESCVYYVDNSDDAVARLISKAASASTNKIWDYNLKMAIRRRDTSVMEKMAEHRAIRSPSGQGRPSHS